MEGYWPRYVRGLVTLIIGIFISNAAKISKASSDQHRRGWVLMEEANFKFKPHLRQGRRAEAAALHTVVFARKQRNMDKLKQILLKVSTPGSPSYGQHMSREEVAEMSAFPEAEEAIRRFVAEQGAEVTRVTLYGDYVFAQASVRVWEDAFQTEFFEFEDLSKQGRRRNMRKRINHVGRIHSNGEKDGTATERGVESGDADTSSTSTILSDSSSRSTIIRALHYSLPEELLPYVSAVFKTAQLPVLQSMGQPSIQRIDKQDSRYEELLKLVKRDGRGGAVPTAVEAGSAAEQLLLRRGSEASSGTKGDWISRPAGAVTVQPLRGGGHISDATAEAQAGILRPLDVIVDGYVTPDLINEVYDIYDNKGSQLTSQAIYASLEQTVSPSDLQEFQDYFDLPEEDIAYYYGGYVDDNACRPNSNDCIEANMDIQYIMAVAQNVPTTWYYWDDDDAWVAWITAVADMSNPPQVWSISYASYEDAFSSTFLDSFSDEAIKLSNAGVTIMAASGDDGVAGFLARDGTLPCGYFPMFPASNPYVTAVGGTMGPEDDDDEVTCQSDEGSSITTGGGFSNYYDRDSFQDDFVDDYFDEVDGTSKEPVSGYSGNKRGLPDVALLANKYLVMADDELLVVSGTSASSPVMAGMVALVNSARVEQGNSTLGWLNPLLYSEYASFVNDITKGDNKCLAAGYGCCSQGFYAAEGWDPATGLGSIDFYEFLLSLANVQSIQIDETEKSFFDRYLTEFIVAMIVVGSLVALGLLILLLRALARYRAKQQRIANRIPLDVLVHISDSTSTATTNAATNAASVTGRTSFTQPAKIGFRVTQYNTVVPA